LVDLNNPLEFKPEFRRSSEWMNQLCVGRQPILNDDILGILIAAQDSMIHGNHFILTPQWLMIIASKKIDMKK